MEELDVRGARGSVELLPAEDGDAVVRLRGEIDISNVEQIGATVDAIAVDADQQVVFDLSDLQFLDSSGIALILRTAARVGGVRLRRPTRIVRRVIEAAGLDGVLQVEP